MPGVLSTIKDTVYGRVWSFPYNCYEVGHGWTPYCSEAACDVGLTAFKNSLPLYSSLYLFTQLALQRKFSLEAFLETFRSTLTSASFLGFNFFGGIGVSCLLRNTTDRYYYRLQCILPGFIASYMALLIERPSRRPALAFYLANMSTELLYKSLEIKPINHGETYLFMLGMACWLRFVRIYGFGHDPVSTALKYIIGPLEAKSRSRSKIKQIKCDHESEELLMKKFEERKSKLQAISDSLTSFLNLFFEAHPACPHKGISCVDYSLTPAISRFLMAYTARSLMNLSKSYKLLLKDPLSAFKRAFSAETSLNTGLFMASFVLGSKGVHCLLRRSTGKQETWHSAVAGAVAGMSMLFGPKSTLSTYIVWKCLEQYFFLGVQNGHIKNPEVIICLIYAVAVNVLLYTFALRPKLIRPSYAVFIHGITNHRLHQVNRMVLDVFSKEASAGYEAFFPNLDTKFLSYPFQELVFNWLIQPYE